MPKGTLANWVSGAKRGTDPKGPPRSRSVAELEAEVAKRMEKDVLKNRPTRLPVPLMNRNSRRVHWTRAGTVAVSFLEARPRQKTWPWEAADSSVVAPLRDPV